MKVWILITFFASGVNGTSINSIEFLSKAECQRAALATTGPVKAGKKVLGYSKSICKPMTKPEGFEVDDIEYIFNL